MTSSKIEQVDNNLGQSATTDWNKIATKDEQIQNLKQQLVAAQKQITDNEIRVKSMFNEFRDELDVTKLELESTRLTGRQMKEELELKLESTRLTGRQMKEELELKLESIRLPGRQMKEELTKQNEKYSKAFVKHKWAYVLVVIVVIFAVLTFLLSPNRIVHEVGKTETALMINCQEEMGNLSAYLLSTIYSLSSNQDLQIQKLNDTLNTIQLKTVSESQLVELMHKNISAINKTTLSIVNDLSAHYTYKFMKLRNLVTDWSSKIDVISTNQVLQLQRLAGIEEDLNVTKSHDVQGEINLPELVAELQENITSVVTKTTLQIVNDMKAHYGNEIMKMRNRVKDWSSKVMILRNDQVLHLQRVHDIEKDVNVTKSYMQTGRKLVELVAKLHENISAVNKTTLVGISELKAQQILLHCFSGHSQYNKEPTIKALQMEWSLAKSNNHTFPVTVMVSGISSMVNNMHVLNYHWGNASVNIQEKLVFFSLEKINITHFKVILCEPSQIWCDDLRLINQIKDSSHYSISWDLSMGYNLSHRTYTDIINNEQQVKTCISYSSKSIKFEELLHITSHCQYVVCDRFFISMECEHLDHNHR